MDSSTFSPLSATIATIVTHSREETIRWAEQFTRSLQAGAVIALTGELGAGKTVIAKGIGRGLGVQDEIISPTFNYLLEYQGAQFALYHADLYRIENSRVFEALGFMEYFEKSGVFLIEWAERVANILPSHTIRIGIDRGADELTRHITVAVLA
jgi:tRNA threonylcarbamoyladenosine biosynthesis protein TsaE